MMGWIAAKALDRQKQNRGPLARWCRILARRALQRPRPSVDAQWNYRHCTAWRDQTLLRSKTVKRDFVTSCLDVPSRRQRLIASIVQLMSVTSGHRWFEERGREAWHMPAHRENGVSASPVIPRSGRQDHPATVAAIDASYGHCGLSLATIIRMVGAEHIDPEQVSLGAGKGQLLWLGQ